MKDRKILTQQDAAKMIATCRAGNAIDLRDRALIIVGLETGMSRMSLAGMTLETIRLCKSGYPIAPVPIKGSGDGLYPVPLSDVAMIAIEPWRQWLRGQEKTKGPLFRPLKRQIARGGKLLYEAEDGPLSLRAIYKIVTHRAELARLTNIKPSVFRSTFVAWRAHAGLPMQQIAAITGHRLSGVFTDISADVGQARNATPSWLATLLKGAS